MSSRKRQLFDALIGEVRRSQTATDRFDQAVADAVGINRTDMRAVDVLEREGPVPAGRLAEATGLTTGAITTVLDRLERSGMARRIRDSSDRRRVLVELTAKARGFGELYYKEHVTQAERLYRLYSESQLELLLDFVRRGREFNEDQAEALERRNRKRGAGRAASGGEPSRSEPGGRR